MKVVREVRIQIWCLQFQFFAPQTLTTHKYKNALQSQKKTTEVFKYSAEQDLDLLVATVCD